MHIPLIMESLYLINANEEKGASPRHLIDTPLSQEIQ